MTTQDASEMNIEQVQAVLGPDVGPDLQPESPDFGTDPKVAETCQKIYAEYIKEQTDALKLPQPLKRKIQDCVKSINEVLGPQCFKSDWRLKWENKRRRVAHKNSERKFKPDKLTPNNVRPEWKAKKPKVDPFPNYVPPV